MKKLKLFYNPASGDKGFKAGLDDYISAFQIVGYETHLFRLSDKRDMQDHISSMPHNHYDAIAVAGGDGTVNLAINSLIAAGHNAPLLIIPAGTANDFASFLGLSKAPADCARMLKHGNIINCDVGLCNDKHFINVCGAGLFSHVSQEVDHSMKSTLGKPAYYIKSLEEIPNFQPLSMRITNSTNTFEEDVLLFLVLNTSGTGGFENLAPTASITDGLFDFIAFRASPILDLGRLLFKIIKQDYLDDPGVIYFKDDYVKIELLSGDVKYNLCDIDGEYGPKMPLVIRQLHNKLPLLMP